MIVGPQAWRAGAVGWLAAAVLAAAAACGRETAVETPRIVSASAEREISATGVAEVRSRIRVQFDREFRTIRRDIPLASYFTVILAVPGGERELFVESAERAGDRGNVVELVVDVVVSEGSRVAVERRAFVPGATDRLEARIEGGLPVGQAALANGAWQFTDPAVVEETQEPVPTAVDADSAAMRAALQAHLRARGASAAVEAAALSLYDAIPVQLVPSPKARAALAALTGTFAQPAIAWLLTTENCTGQPASIVFAPPPEFPEMLARVTHDTGGRRTVWLNPRLEGERLEFLMPLLAHEAIHCDTFDGRWEEVAATAFDSFLYLHLVAAIPELARAGTPMARTLNTDLLALLNSGRWVPESVGVLPSPKVSNALPGSTSAADSFAEHVVQAYGMIRFNESPTEELARQYTRILAGIAGLPEGDPFQLGYLDRLLGQAAHPAVIAAAVQALRLAPAP
jgi:hypothetical protein